MNKAVKKSNTEKMKEMDGRYFEFDGCGGMGRWRTS
jgi:hypothetical protein